MKRSVVIGCLAAVIAAGAVIFAGISIFYFLTSSGGKVEGFDKLVARVDEAAKLGHVEAGLEIPVCQADTPLHIGALVHDFLRGKQVLTCSGSLGANEIDWGSLKPAAKLGKPLTVVDLDRKRFDAINSRLPAPLLAPNVNAASTIIFTHCTTAKIGSYGFIFPQGAYRRDCGLLFVAQDGPSRMRILGITTYSGWPPKSVSSRFSFGDVVADRPVFDMQNYIVTRSETAAMPGFH